MRKIVGLIAASLMPIAMGACSAEESAVVQKCEAIEKTADCQRCCEQEGWEKGSPSGGECECSSQQGT